MDVKVSTVRSGRKTYRYLTLAESFRNEGGQPRSRIVARLGEMSEMTTSGELERIVDALSAQVGTRFFATAHRRVSAVLWGDGRL